MMIDNIGTHRIGQRIRERVLATDYAAFRWSEAEAELAQLSDEDLETLCMGEQGVVQVSPFTEQVLTFLFEEIYP